MRTVAGGGIAVAWLAFACLLAGCTGQTPGTPAPAELAGSESCAECHEQEAQFWQYGAHRTVACEQCHGPGRAHAEAEGGDRPAMDLGGTGLCLSCHGQGAASPSRVTSRIQSFEDHLSQLEREHRIKLDRRKSGTDCVYCHDPHLVE